MLAGSEDRGGQQGGEGQPARRRDCWAQCETPTQSPHALLCARMHVLSHSSASVCAWCATAAISPYSVETLAVFRELVVQFVCVCVCVIA